MDDYARTRLNFGWFRSGQLTKPVPGPDASEEEKGEYRFSVLWAERTHDSFLESCEQHLDDVLREIDQMVFDIVEYLRDLPDETIYPSRDSWPDKAQTRFPWCPSERVGFADPSQYGEAVLALDLPTYWDPSGADFSNLARFQFANWRGLTKAEFTDLSLSSLGRLINEHEALRVILCHTVNKARDLDGYWRHGPSRVRDDLVYGFLYSWPPIEDPNDVV